eukprot:11328149-Heterocapsa_arctica.AAC.1
MKTGCRPRPSDIVRQFATLIEATFSVKSIMGSPAKASAHSLAIRGSSQNKAERSSSRPCPKALTLLRPWQGEPPARTTPVAPGAARRRSSSSRR